jgi:beta-galactosidase
MKKLVLFFIATICSLSLFCLNIPLQGYEYGSLTAPVGDEWNNPQKIAYNKEQPHAWFFPFENVENARKVLPENSAYWKSMNGTWRFHWSPDPEHRPADFFKTDYDAKKWDEVKVPMSWNIYGIQKNGDLKYGVPIYVNQRVIFKHSVVVDDWKGGVMREPDKSWTTYKYRNEVGSYLKTFEIPSNWDGREVFISFDGVDSFFYIWINGHYVGFSKNSRNTANFNITRFLKTGTNIVAVEVYRNSDGSFLESQDMFRLPGIFRTVALYSTPQTYIKDLKVTTDLDKNYENGSLSISADILNLSKKTAKKYHVDYLLYANKLYSDENTVIPNVLAKTDLLELKGFTTATAHATIYVVKPNLWSSEAPNRYTLVAQLKDSKNRVVETVSTIVGFRKVEIKETPASEDEFGLAGRYYYVNGKTIKLKGVNRHETNPSLGHAITREQMQEEVMMMKRANINQVRDSHYPDDPFWYYLCNKYGIYLEDEANIESHEYYYGKESLSHPVEWLNAHVDRVMEMVHSNINNPCIVIWSLGNEAGPGHNFVAAYDSLKTFDHSRPVQYERNNDIVDMGSNQYPSVGWVREAVKGTADIKYPFHISEYAHSMGNAEGNLIDYWKAIESTNYFCGGCIWDWIDQAMYYYEKKAGQKYMAFGGDFGDYPNDGQFVMNGIIFANMKPKPQYYEVKKVYQNIQVDPVDLKKGKVSIFNKQYFSDLSDYDAKWLLYRDGKEIKSGFLNIETLAPRKKQTIKIPLDFNSLDSTAEYFVKIQFLLKEDKPWCQAGYIQAEEQIPVKSAETRPTVLSQIHSGFKHLTPIIENDSIITIRSNGFSVKFNKNQATIYSLTYQDNVIIPNGCGPKIDAFRALTNNDNWAFQPWFENGLYNLHNHVINTKILSNKDGSITLSFSLTAQAPYGAKLEEFGISSGIFKVNEQRHHPFGPTDFKFMADMLWTVYPDGSIELESAITSNKSSLILPRLGYVMELPKNLKTLTYYGRGPVDNYPDRKTGQNIEIHQTQIADEINIWPKPQDTGNHEDVRWCAVTDGSGNGAAFIAPDKMSVQALPNSALDMTMAQHPYQLPQQENNYLHLDVAVTGLGGNSCGQGGPLEQDRVKADEHRIAFMIRPVNGNLEKVTNISVNGEKPLIILRTEDGMVQIKSSEKDSPIWFKIGNGKLQNYSQPFEMTGAGNITAWDKTRPALSYSIDFEKLEAVPVKVIFASSEELSDNEGNASHLVDNDPSTYWHTMYSVTVAKYPHWVDFDAGAVKNIKGFVYLPRQDSRNGNIKNYEIQISSDGKNWSEPVSKGSFENDQKEKRINLLKPVKARFIRFTALSSQDGQDFATGAQFSVLTE